MPYVFGTTVGPDYYVNRSVCPFAAPAETDLVAAVQAYWTSFARTGSPTTAAAAAKTTATATATSTGAGAGAGAGTRTQAAWPAFDAAAGGGSATMQLSTDAPAGFYEGGAPHVVRDFKQADCDFWRTLELNKF